MLGRAGVGSARRRLSGLVSVVVPLVVAYVPLLLSSPGRVGADTKTYLYLDPGKLLRGASSVWDADTALGTVTHQNIGYLWPMGPFYWSLDTLGSPDWVAQRLWLGTLLVGAGLGVRFLLRTLGWHGPGLLVAVLAYELSPYLLHYSARISAVLLPWAGLPWMIGLTIRAARTNGWRHPALFALVAVTVGSVNATSLLQVGLAPVLWLAHAVVTERSIASRRALAVAARIGLLTGGVSLWWIAGLVLQGRYSLPVTRYTETYEVVADAATAPEILRGLGYWFFYGNDKFGPWIEPSVDFTQGVWLLFVSFGLAVLAIATAGLVRWRHRSYFVLLLAVGALVGVGAHPYDSPSPLGRLFRDFTRTDAGLAMRSTPRAVPLVALSTAVFLGVGLNALWRRWPGWYRVMAPLVLIGVLLNNPPMWKTRMIEKHLNRAEELPEYWIEAAARLDEFDDGSRVWELPGSDFASYRWGNTVDPITPGLIDRGYVARELVPFGSARSADLLTAIDHRLQEDILDPESVAPVARLLGAGDIVHRADLTYERYRTARPVQTAELLRRAPGISEAESFGAPISARAGPEQPMEDDILLAGDPAAPEPAPVTRFAVDSPLPEVRTRAIRGATILVGDAEGVIDAAGAGLVDL
ncbi:MAG: alpha-(1-_3)-arabinofuranosyltransferase family protein, partial [Acidimicrobiales bacterium]